MPQFHLSSHATIPPKTRPPIFNDTTVLPLWWNLIKIPHPAAIRRYSCPNDNSSAVKEWTGGLQTIQGGGSVTARRGSESEKNSLLILRHLIRGSPPVRIISLVMRGQWVGVRRGIASFGFCLGVVSVLGLLGGVKTM